MNGANWHLVLNHLPLIGALIGLLILVAGFVWKSQPVIKRVAMGVFIFAALAAIPAFLTGEGAEEVAENLPGVAESFVEKHEDWGKIFLISIEILGVLALITLLADILKSRVARALYILVFVAAAGVMFTAKKAGTSGGEIRHTEIRGDGQGAVNVNNEPAGGEVEEED